MSESAIERDIQSLTETIHDPRSKPILRSTIALGLRDLGHDKEEIERVLDTFFEETVH